MKKLLVGLIIASLLITMAGCGLNTGSDEYEDKAIIQMIVEETPVPVSTPTPEPFVRAEATAKPEAEYTEVPVASPIVVSPEIDTAELNVFQNSVFVGDSVSLKLSYYVMAQRSEDPDFMGNAQFLVSGSLSAFNALWEVSDESVHPTYMGEKQLIEDSISQMEGVDKLFVMLGMNDIGYGLDVAIGNMEEFLCRVMEKNPGLKVYVQSVTPTTDTTTLQKREPENILKYNEMLKELCYRYGFTYVDIYSAVCTEDGYLRTEYCSDPEDMGIHFTDEGCAIWLARLTELLNQ